MALAGSLAYAGITGRAAVRAQATPARTSTLPPPERATFTPAAAQFAVSPDGRLMAFTAIAGGKSALWVQRLGSLSATLLAGTDGATYPFWSPDARSIGFFADKQLKTISARGEGLRVLCDAPDGRGGSWSSDDVIIFTPSPADPLFRVPAKGGACNPFTRFLSEDERSHRWPHFLPDGRRFVFLVTSKLAGTPQVRMGALDSSEPIPLGIRSDSSATYSAGHILFMRDGVLMAAGLDVDARHTIGDAFAVARGVRADLNFHTALSASSTGIWVTQQDALPRTTRLTWVNRKGKALGTIGESGQYMNIALAPDDRHVAVSLVTGTPDNRDVWVIDSRKGTAARLTFDAANDGVPLWSRDARSIVFESYRTGPPSIFRMALDRVGGETPLLHSAFADIPEDWSVDGRFVVFMRSASHTYNDLWILPLDGSRQPFPFVVTTAAEDNARFDPTGRWIAYASNTSGRYEVYVRPFPPADGVHQISREGGSSPVWRADGKELFFLTSDGTLMAAAIDSAVGFRSGDPHALFRSGVSEIVTAGNRHQYAVSRDGRRFLINRADPHDESPPLTVHDGLTRASDVWPRSRLAGTRFASAAMCWKKRCVPVRRAPLLFSLPS